MEKLLEKGKVMVEGRCEAVVGSDIAAVRAYDPKDGRYICQLPNRQLVKVKPSLVVRHREVPPLVDDGSVVSKYSSLKTW